MKIKNLAGFLLVVILLATGTTPVVAHGVSQCGSVEPIRPGDTVTDAVSDISVAHVDITEVETSLSEKTLTVVFHLRDLPETLTFNRTELGKGTKEYEWEVAIDVDNDRSTGPGGFDTLLTAYHIAFLSHEGSDADLTAPIGDMLEASTWEIHSDGSTSTSAYGMGSLTVSVEENTIAITGVIPGITSESRLTFSAYDVQFPGDADQLACHDPYSESVGPWGCSSGAALTRPGQTVTDEIEGAAAAYVDITKVSTSLSGETLTVVFHLRDVPETLEFNRNGVREDMLEYNWNVMVDVDNDAETGGFSGEDYTMSASRFVHSSSSGETVHQPIEEAVQANSWQVDATGGAYLSEISLAVSSEENTITLVGDIPGITSESRLEFEAYDFLHGSEQVACQVLSGSGGGE